LEEKEIEFKDRKNLYFVALIEEREKTQKGIVK
jgi:hypothetical protein